MKRNRFLESLGWRYIANHWTKEIHRANSTDSRCHFDLMKQAQRITKRKLKKLLNRGYNGCRWCLREYDIE